MKNIISFFYSASSPHDLKRILSNDFFHINNISKHFDEAWIIDLSNLKIFSDKFPINNDFVKNFKFNKNVKFKKPLNFFELKNFFLNKCYNGIVCIKVSIDNFILFYVLKKMNLNLFQISNIGNVQQRNINIKKNFFRSFFNNYSRMLIRKIYIVLIFLNIFPRFKIRFLSNSRWLKKNRNFKSLITNFLNLKSSDKLQIINSRSYDLMQKKTKNINKNFIILLDEPMNDYQYVNSRGIIGQELLNKYYKKFNEKLQHLSKLLNRKVIVCIHPNDNLKLKKKIFKSFRVKQFETKKYILKAALVLVTESSAAIDAILNYKPLLSYKSNIFDQNQKFHLKHYVSELGIPQLDIDADLSFFPKKNTILKIKRKKYETYIKKYISPDSSGLPGHLLFANIIKKKYVNRK